VPVVHTQHAVMDDPQPYLLPIRRVLSFAVHTVVGCSPATVRDINARNYAPGAQVVCIENGIPLSGRPVGKRNGTPPVIGVVARLVEVKGHRFFLDAIHQLRAKGLVPHIELLGDGPERSALEAQVERLGLSEQVHFRGNVHDVPERLAGFDLFCLPSLSEAMPISILEAAAAALPLMVTTGGGGPRLLEQGAGGRSVPPGDATALAVALGELLELPPEARRRLGDASRQTVLTHYDIAATADAYLKVFGEAVS